MHTDAKSEIITLLGLRIDTPNLILSALRKPGIEEPAKAQIKFFSQITVLGTVRTPAV